MRRCLLAISSKLFYMPGPWGMYWYNVSVVNVKYRQFLDPGDVNVGLLIASLRLDTPRGRGQPCLQVEYILCPHEGSIFFLLRPIIGFSIADIRR